MNLTEHFTLDELTRSQAATRLGLDNTPGPKETQNLLRVAVALEQVRALVGKAINVNSGYRSLKVNAAVGSGPTSDHIKGLAADITVSGMTAKALALLIVESDIPYHQVIHEGTWVHLGLSEGVPRRQALTAHFSPSGTTYSQGIV